MLGGRAHEGKARSGLQEVCIGSSGNTAMGQARADCLRSHGGGGAEGSVTTAYSVSTGNGRASLVAQQ